MSKSFVGFDADLVRFLKELDANNNREWFTANKARFEASVQGPLLEFIERWRRGWRKCRRTSSPIRARRAGR